MTSVIVSVSQTELSQRRHKLRQQRRTRVFQKGWRFLAISGLAAGLVWLVTSPGWVIRRPEQVKVEGNRFIQAQTVRSLLPISYPQSLLRVEPRDIAEHLKAQMPIADVTVNRRLFPPELMVQLKERYPVAIALPTPDAMPIAPGKSTGLPSASQKVGLIDENGTWIPLEIYTSLGQKLKLPTLRVIGNPEQYRSQWPKLYQSINRSPVKISEVDWRESTNLILKTEIGIVYFGAYSRTLFDEQLHILDRMRRLPSRLSSREIAYIDLRNLDSPAVQMVKSKNPVKTGTQ